MNKESFVQETIGLDISLQQNTHEFSFPLCCGSDIGDIGDSGIGFVGFLYWCAPLFTFGAHQKRQKVLKKTRFYGKIGCHDELTKEVHVTHDSLTSAVKQFEQGTAKAS